jgi:hypothetical protein
MDEFISSIHNYCDRWCERCAFTRHCRVFADEQRFLEREVLAGNDPHSDESAIRSIEDSLGQAMEMLAEMADESGIDLNNLPPVEARERNREHPLFLQATDWGKRLDQYIRRMRAELPGVAEEVGAQFIREYSGCHDERVLEEAGHQAEEALARYRDALELLGRYRFLIPVKIGRATSFLTEEDEEDDRYDANGTAKLVYELLGKVIAALWVTAEFHRPWLDDVFSLTAGAEALKISLDETLPGHKAFVRPGFDE